MAFVVNGERIEDAVIEEEFEGIKRRYEDLGEVICCDRDAEFLEYARNNVINRWLLPQDSRNRFGEPGEAETEEIVAFLQEEHGGRETFFEKTGFSVQDDPELRRRVANSISVDKTREEVIGPDPDFCDKEIEAWIFSMRDGEISPVLATHYGFHIFKVTGRKNPEPVPFGTVRDEVWQHFMRDRRERRMKEWIDSLRAKSSIEEIAIKGEAVEPAWEPLKTESDQTP